MGKKQTIQSFKKTVTMYYSHHARSFPWRETRNPYHILVSEYMLQQTQTERVIPKYLSFLSAFPSVESLANAPFAEVISLWQGLGYNRRARYLHSTAKEIHNTYNGIIPSATDSLLDLPGIGPYTASAIATFAYNKPTIMIETNIRTSVIYHFFPNRRIVRDSVIRPILAESLDENPRDWYYALMDYGAMIKKTYGNFGSRSTSFSKQSMFKGSDREKRGMIIRYLTNHDTMPITIVPQYINTDTEHSERIITKLVNDGLITIDDSSLIINIR